MCRSGGFVIIARSVRMLVDGKCSGIECKINEECGSFQVTWCMVDI